MAKPRLYLETTVVSYLTARPSRDPITLGHQEFTRRWWKSSRRDYAIRVSSIVAEEASLGDAEEAAKRMEIISALVPLTMTEQTYSLAQRYMKARILPEKALRDALHIALASVHEMDYLVTWNCRHIASGQTRERIGKINQKVGLPIPKICTPEELP